MTLAAAPLTLGTTMTGKAFYWINSPIDPVSCKIITAVRHGSLRFTVIFQGWLEFNSCAMTVRAEALGMAHRAYFIVLRCRIAVVFDKRFRVIDSIERYLAVV